MFEAHFKTFAKFLVTFATGSGFGSTGTKDTTSQDKHILLLHSVKTCRCPNYRKQSRDIVISLYIFFSTYNLYWAKRESVKWDSAKRDLAKRDSTKRDLAKRDSAKWDSAKHDSAKRDSAKRDSTKHDSEKRDSAKHDSVKRDSAKRNSAKIQLYGALYIFLIPSHC